MAAFEHTAYETLLIEAAVSAAKTVFTNGEVVTLDLNRWGSPIFKYDLSPFQVNLRVGKFGAHANFDQKLTKITFNWFNDKFEDQSATVKLPKEFAAKFAAEFNTIWANVDPCVAIAKGTTQDWYRKAPSDFTDKDIAEHTVAKRAEQALATRLVFATTQPAVTFEFRGKKITGKLHAVKTSVRKAPPGGDPTTIHSIQVDADKLRYTISLHNVVSA